MKAVKCVSCKNHFNVADHRANSAKYCSNKCKSNKIEKTCATCSSKYLVKSSSSSSSKYCSRKCVTQSQKKRIFVKCGTCGNSFEKRENATNTRFCSRECLTGRNWKNGSRKCSICKKIKPASEIIDSNLTKCGKGSFCIDCKPKYGRAKRLKAEYNITEQDYEKLAKKQNYVCAICKQSKKLLVDHCHKTGDVRGLLCTQCNTGIGMLQDNPQILLSAISYLSVGH